MPYSYCLAFELLKIRIAHIGRLLRRVERLCGAVDHAVRSSVNFRK